MPIRESQLLELLTELAPNLRKLLRGLPQGNVMVQELPGDSASAAELAGDALDILLRHAAVNRELFQLLREQFPGRSVDISRIEILWYRDHQKHLLQQHRGQFSPERHVERPELQEALSSALKPVSGRPPQPICLVGMPGVGKSHLIDWFLSEHGERFEEQVCRLEMLDEPWTWHSAISELAAQLEVDEDAVPTRLGAGRTLVVLENLDSRQSTEAAAALQQRLPGAALLATGRARLGQARGSPWRAIPVPCWTPGQALLHLNAELGSLGGTIPLAEQHTLLRALGSHPLAIHLAAGYLRRGLSVQDFLERLSRSKLSLGPADPEHTTVDGDRRILSAAFTHSLRQLADGASDTALLRDALVRLALAPSAGFCEHLGQHLTGLGHGLFQDLWWRAEELSLLERVPQVTARTQRHIWRLHPLVIRYFEDRLPLSEQVTLARQTKDWFLAHLNEAPEETRTERWARLAALRASLMEVLHSLDPQEAAEALHHSAAYALTHGPYMGWLQVLQTALSAELTGAQRLSLLLQQGQLALRAGEPDLAWRSAEEAVGALGSQPDPEQHAAVLDLRVQLLEQRGDLLAASELLERDLLPLYSPGSVPHALYCGRLADISRLRGRPDQALSALQTQCLPVFRAARDELGLAMTWGRIADVLQSQGRTQEALELRLTEELPVYRLLDDLHMVAITRRGIAQLRMGLGQHKEALELLLHEVIPALEAQEDQRELALSWGLLADNYQIMGRHDEAHQTRSAKVLPLFSALDDRRGQAITLLHMAHSQGDSDPLTALQALRDAKGLFDTLSDPPNQALSRLMLALLLRRMGGHRSTSAEADTLLQEALELARPLGLPLVQTILKALPPEHR